VSGRNRERGSGRLLAVEVADLEAELQVEIDRLGGLFGRHRDLRERPHADLPAAFAAFANRHQRASLPFLEARVCRRPFKAATAGSVFAPSDHGQIKIVPEPAGTRGYEDLRVRANRERLGHGVRPSVASPGDLVRMMEALDRQPDPLVLETMRRVLEIDRAPRIER